jgi:hypothetical protein
MRGSSHLCTCMHVSFSRSCDHRLTVTRYRYLILLLAPKQLGFLFDHVVENGDVKSFNVLCNVLNHSVKMADLCRSAGEVENTRESRWRSRCPCFPLRSNFRGSLPSQFDSLRLFVASSLITDSHFRLHFNTTHTFQVTLPFSSTLMAL